MTLLENISLSVSLFFSALHMFANNYDCSVYQLGVIHTSICVGKFIITESTNDEKGQPYLYIILRNKSLCCQI